MQQTVLAPYASPTPCPVLTWRLVLFLLLGVCSAMCGTELAYGAMRCGTELACGAISLRNSVQCSVLSWRMVLCDVWYCTSVCCCANVRTELVYGATRSRGADSGGSQEKRGHVPYPPSRMLGHVPVSSFAYAYVTCPILLRVCWGHVTLSAIRACYAVSGIAVAYRQPTRVLCAVLTYIVPSDLLPAYGRAMRCPVLTWRSMIPGSRGGGA
eukprot:3940541-Rhodomonas_salina.2